MATVTLDYNAQSVQASKALEYIMSLGCFKVRAVKAKKTGLERAFDDIENGRVHRLITPKRLSANG